MAHKLIIDADPGIADALAILCALIDPDADVVGITAVEGVVSGLQATRNATSLVELLDLSQNPRVGGWTQDMQGPPRDAEPAAALHCAMDGQNGLGEFVPPEIDLHNRRDSAKLIVDLVRDNPNEVTLLTLGPLTNVARAFELVPDLPGMLGGIVCLAGAVDYGGNVTAAAEFNIWAAPGPARSVLRSPAAKTLVPLDVSSRVMLTPEQTSAIRPVPSESATTVEEMLHYSLRAHRQHMGVEGIRLDALAALATALHPDAFEARAMAVDVEVAGELTRGTTVFDRRGVKTWQTNIDVVTGIDYLGVVDYFMQVICRV